MMKPRLYEANTLVFENNGFGSLMEATECRVKQAFGAAELEMKYPVQGRLFKLLKYKRIILAETEPLSDAQPFAIYRITSPMNGIVTVYARHVCYDLDGYPVRPFTASTAATALAGLKANTMAEHPYSFETNVEKNGSFAFTAPTSTWALLGGTEGSVLDIFHGEYVFDRYTVRLLQRRGADRGVSLRYGKNLQTLEQDANCAGCYTGIVPYWTDSQTGESIYTEPVNANGSFGYTRVLSVDFTDKFETKPTEAQLQEKAAEYIADNAIGEPTVSLKVKFVPLEQTEELSHLALLERVQMGDTVHVYFPELQVDVSARVVETDYDCLHGRYREVTIGKAKHTIADVIVAQQKQLDSIPNATALAVAMNQATQAIVGAKGGSVQLLDTDGDGLPDALYIADNADPAAAKKVWRLNYAGWACSSNGYNGPFTMAATIEDGLVADFITAGILNADLIKTGTINADLIKAGKLGVDYLDVENLVVKALKTTQERDDGFKGIVQTDTGRVRIISDDGSLQREVMTLGADAHSANFATTWASMLMKYYYQGKETAYLQVDPIALELKSSADAYGKSGVFGVYMSEDTGEVWVELDSLVPTSGADMQWEYIESLGKTVLVKK